MSTPDRIFRLPEIAVRINASRSTIYAWMASDRFPKPIKLGPRAVGWLESEIDEWIEKQKAERDGCRHAA